MTKDRLRQFITFILLLSVPKNRAALGGDSAHTEQRQPDLLPLTQFLKTTLERVRAHELSQVQRTCRVEIAFRIRTPLLQMQTQSGQNPSEKQQI
jgi:hypothetical protein